MGAGDFLVVTIRQAHLLLHGGVAVMLESSRINHTLRVLCSSRLALKQNSGMLNSYIWFLSWESGLDSL
jgi:hypothetical protein